MNEHRSRFKAYLIDPSQLPAEAQELSPYFAHYRGQHQAGQLNSAEWAGLFIMTYLEKRQPGKWWMKKSASWPEAPGDFLSRWWSEYQFKKLPESITRALYHWCQKNYALILREDLITPYEMLQHQARGERVATLSHRSAVAGLLVDGQRDAFEFLLHDLVHADLFFARPQDFSQQKSFFESVLRLLEQGHFADEIQCDREFEKDFHYLISDMNSHPAHLASLLKASYVKYLLGREGKTVRDPLSADARRELESHLLLWQNSGRFEYNLAEAP